MSDKDYRVKRRTEWPKKKYTLYKNLFSKRKEARNFCRNRSMAWIEGLVIVHPDGTEEKYEGAFK